MSTLYQQDISPLTQTMAPLSDMIGGPGAAGCATDVSQGWAMPTAPKPSYAQPGTNTGGTGTGGTGTGTGGTSVGGTSPSQMSQSSSCSVDFGNVNLASTLPSLGGKAITSIADLIGGDTSGSLGAAGGMIMPALTSILGQATGSPVWGQMGTMAAPVVSQGLLSLTGATNPLLAPALQNTTSMIDAGYGFGSGLLGSANSALGGMAGDTLGSIGFVDPVGSMMGADANYDHLTGVGGIVQSVLGSVPLVGPWLGAIMGLFSSDHPSMDQYQAAATEGQILGQSGTMVNAMRKSGMTDQQIADWATKNNYNWMLGPASVSAGTEYPGLPSTGSGYASLPDPSGGYVITELVSPQARSFLDQLAMQQVNKPWAEMEGAPGGWNVPAGYEPYISANPSGNLDPTFTSSIGMTFPGDLANPSPAVQALFDPLTKQYTDLGYDQASAQRMAMNLGGVTDQLSANLEGQGATFGAATPFFSAKDWSYGEIMPGSGSGWSWDPTKGIQYDPSKVNPQGYNLMPTLGAVLAGTGFSPIQV